ncbi:MAG: MGMT family protein [Actinomycetota bacterium]|nr:MGMT family protein [Actinomycetota bacterium]
MAMNNEGYYALDTALGEIGVIVMDGVPVGISLTGDQRHMKAASGPPSGEVIDILEALRRYFAGHDIPDDLAGRLISRLDISPFSREVYYEVASILMGKTLSYGEVAERAGKPGAARAVGGIMRANPYPIVIPCHRVIKSDGQPGGYGGREDIKIWLLTFEGAR